MRWGRGESPKKGVISYLNTPKGVRDKEIPSMFDDASVSIAYLRAKFINKSVTHDIIILFLKQLKRKRNTSNRSVDFFNKERTVAKN